MLFRSPNLSRSPSAIRAAIFYCFIAFIALALPGASAWADSPPNLNSDIAWDEDPQTPGDQQTYAGVAAIQAAFNNGRRQEEIQLNLAPNALGNLTLPDQATWDSYSHEAKVALILNAERVVRGGTVVNVIGLPFTGDEPNIDNLAQTHAQYLVDNNTTGHWALADSIPSSGSLPIRCWDLVTINF